MSSSQSVSFAACLFGLTLFLTAPFVEKTSKSSWTVASPVELQSVTVSPSTATAEGRKARTGGHVLTFTVTNTGDEIDTYEITCVGVARANCSGWSPKRLTLDGGQFATVDASFEALDPGTGLVSLTAFSPNTRAMDRGSYRVPVTQ